MKRLAQYIYNHGLDLWVIGVGVLVLAAWLIDKYLNYIVGGLQ